jgi:nicotinamide-nucleotide adenylyltransferase
MNALFIGRFQPFHNGHLKLIKSISKEYDKIIIAIGSSQYQNTNQNPFTYNERNEMISNTLKKNNVKNFKIIAIPDIHKPSNWVEHVTKINKDFDIVLTNNSYTKKLFEEKGYNVKKTMIYNRDILSGKNIRKKIINDENYQDLVPDIVYNYLNKINAIDRLKKIN